MKKTLLGSILLVSSIFSPLSIADLPNQVLLHYTGTIISQPCAISIGSTTTLDMGDVDIATLSAKGAISPWLNYNIQFSHCDVSTNISVGSSLQSGYAPGNKSFATYDSASQLLKDIGLQVNITVSGKDYNMINYFDMSGYRYVITPTQRDAEIATSFNLPIKFSFINLTGKAPASGKITGVYTICVVYN